MRMKYIKKKLILLSDLSLVSKRTIDYELMKTLKSKSTAPTIGYIPSCTDPDRRYYKLTTKYYSSIGINKVRYFDLDLEYDEDKILEVFNCDAIHLSGGNTFYFLNSIKKRKLIDLLKSYVNNHGILIGVSAGSIIMTKSIELAGFGENGDQNKVELQDLNSLGLVDFEFLPHWNGQSGSVEDLRKYSIAKNITVYACKDNEGIIVENDTVKLIGQIEIIRG